MSLTTLQRQALERALTEDGIAATSIHSSTRRSLLTRGLLSQVGGWLHITDNGRAALGLPSAPVALPPLEYGFYGLEHDGFKALAAQLGTGVVGAPLMWARYQGPDYAYQVTEKGRLEAVKMADGSWESKFYEAWPWQAAKEEG